MDKLKEDSLPTIRQMDIERALTAVGWPDVSTHEIVFPSCLVENPSYNPYEIDVKGVFLTGNHRRDKFVPIEEIEFKVWIFDYGIRYDPNAKELAVLPKRVEEPLPFE